MSSDPTEAEEAAIAGAFEALSSPVRLALLRQLREPRTLSEIRLPADEEADAAAMARQSVRRHLDRLVGCGMVATRPAKRDRGPTVEYTLRHQAFFALAEELLELARLRPQAEPPVDTVRGAPPSGAAAPGPSLVLVHGAGVGTIWRLDRMGHRATEWTIGRSRSCAVCVDFDPFASGENTRILLQGGQLHVENVEGSKNGTMLNLAPLTARTVLRHGDILGVGHSLLVFRA